MGGVEVHGAKYQEEGEGHGRPAASASQGQRDVLKHRPCLSCKASISTILSATCSDMTKAAYMALYSVGMHPQHAVPLVQHPRVCPAADLVTDSPHQPKISSAVE